MFTFTRSNKSSQSTDEVLSCAKCSQHDCFGDGKNRIPDTEPLALQWVHEAHKTGRFPGAMHRRTRHISSEWVISWSQRVWGASGVSAQVPKWSSSDQLASVSDQLLSLVPQLGERPQGGAPAPYALDFVYPEGPAAAWLHDEIFSIASCRGGSGTNPALAGTPRHHDIPIFLIGVGFTQTAQTAHLRKSSRVMLAALSGHSVSHWGFTKVCSLLRNCQLIQLPGAWMLLAIVIIYESIANSKHLFSSCYQPNQ